MMHRHSFSGVLVTLSLLLAACGGSAAVSSSSAPASSAPPASSANPAASSSAASASSQASSGAASGVATASSGPIKVGLLEPLTGNFANLGKDNQDGFNLYLESIHNTVAGRTIQVQSADTAGQPDTGLNKAKQLVEQDKVNVLMGITVSSVCNAVAAYLKTAETPLIVSGNCGSEGLLTDASTKSPYVVRFTQSGTQIVDPAADWAYTNGKRKAILLTSDYVAGIENSDMFASAFIKRGGSVVQELHPPLGTTDFGPYLAQLDQSADIMMVFLPGIDGLRFTEQYGNYAGKSKPTFLDLFGQIANGPNLAQLKDKVIGLISEYNWTTAIDTPQNKTFLQQFQAKYPGRVISTDVAQGYVGAQVLEAALKKVNGNIENKQAFLGALYGLNLDTAKGTVKLDQDHDVIQNVYVYTTDKQGNDYAAKLLKTYDNVSRTWDRTQAQIDQLHIGKNKGKWVGMTQQQLAQLEGQ